MTAFQQLLDESVQKHGHLCAGQVIGVRMAMGADSRDVLLMVMRQGLWQIGAGILLGLGLGVDYSLLMTSRFREELAVRGDSPNQVADAVRVTVATAGADDAPVTVPATPASRVTEATAVAD